MKNKKVGRPKLNQDDLRYYSYRLRMNRKEKEELAEFAKRLNMSIAKVIRKAISGMIEHEQLKGEN